MFSRFSMINLITLAVLSLLQPSRGILAQTYTYESLPLDIEQIERRVVSGSDDYSTKWVGTFWNFAYAGKQDDYDYEKNTFRLIYRWGTSSIPSNAILLSCTLTVATTVTSNLPAPPSGPDKIYYTIRKFPLTFSGNHKLKWDAVSNADSLERQYSPRDPNTQRIPYIYNSTTALFSWVQECITNGQGLKLSIKATDENWSAGTISVVDFKFMPDYYATDGISLKLTYRLPQTVNIIPDNNFSLSNGTHGEVKTNGESHTAPNYQAAVTENTNVTLEAVSGQTDAQGYEMVYNDFSPEVISNWIRIKGNTSSHQTFNNPNTFTVVLADEGATFQAQQRKYYKMNLDKCLSEISETQNAGLQTKIVEMNSGAVTAPATASDENSNTYLFSCWDDNQSTDNPRTVSPTDNTTYTANYKALSGTNNENAFAQTGARKYVRTAATTSLSNGLLHKAYASMGKIWYEVSADNGTTWQIINNVRPVSSINFTSKNPAMACGNGNASGAYTALTYFQEDVSNPEYHSLKLVVMRFTTSTEPAYQAFTIANSIHCDNTGQMYATVSMNCDNRVLVVYGTSDWCNLSFWYGQISSSGITQIQSGSISGGSTCMRNPTAGTYSGNNQGYHLAWEGTNNAIYYKTLYETGNFTLEQTNVQDISTGAGYGINYGPSIVVLEDNEARISWLGRNVDPYYNYENPLDEFAGTVVVFRGVNNSNYFFNFDENVSHVNMNSTTTGTVHGYIIGWVKGFAAPYQNWYMKNTGFYDFLDFGTSGSALQVTNGFTSNYSDMSGMALQPSSPLSILSQSSPLGMQKQMSQDLILARSGVAFKDSAQFMFRIGDIQTGGVQVKFPEIPDTVLINSLALANHYLVSDPFPVNDNSGFTYSIKYGTTDTAKAKVILGESGTVSFKVVLEDAMTGQVLGSFDDITFSKKNVQQYNNTNYEVLTQGIGSRTVVLRLIITDGNEMHFAVTQKVTPLNQLQKKSFQQVSYTGSALVKDYELSQNYPNPFNPVTTIRYALPTSPSVPLLSKERDERVRLVTLKVYDILGKEIRTLVNEEKTAGRYTVSFSASSLPSGTYFYELCAGDSRAVKKMVVLK